MKEPGCRFCQIIAGEFSGHIIDDNEQVIVFLSLENHPLVVPKEHIPDLYAMPDEIGAAVMAEAGRMARAMKSGLKCDGIYLTQANERAAGQDVFHYHLHLYPCWGDRVRNATREFVGSIVDQEDMTEEKKTAMKEKLRRELESPAAQ